MDGEPEATYLTTPGQPEVRELFPRAGLLAVNGTDVALLVDSAPPRGLHLPLRVGTLAIASLAGGAPRSIAEDVNAAEWPHGASGRPAVVRVVTTKELSTGTRVELDGKPLADELERVWPLRAAPDGTRLAYASNQNGRRNLTIVDRARRKRTLVTNWIEITGLAWSVDGREIWFTGRHFGGSTIPALFAVDMQGAIRELLHGPSALRLHDVAPDGRVLLAREIVTRDAAVRRPGTPDQPLSWFDHTLIVGVSDAGDMVAFAELGQAAKPSLSGYLFVRKLDGSPAVQLGDYNGMALSPDGKYAVGWDPSSTLDDERLLRIPTGPGDPRPVERGRLRIFVAGAFSPDGRRLILSARETMDDPDRIYVQELDGEPRAIAPPGSELNDGTQPMSPDGRWVFAYIDGQPRLVPTDGGPTREVKGMKPLDVFARWSPDGQLYIQRLGDTRTTIYKVDPETGKRIELFTIAPPDPTGIEIPPRAILTPDGKTCAYSFVRHLSQLFVVDGLK